MLKVADLGARSPLLDATRHKVGGARNFAPDNNPQTIINLTGDDELAGVVMVAIDVSPIAPLIAGDVVRARAVIKWGVEGHQHEAEVDIGSGVTLAVPASSLRVDAANEGTQVTLAIGATVGYFPRGGPSIPTRTRYDDAGVLAAGVITADVPLWAAAVSVMRDPVAAPFTLEFLDSNNVVSYQINVPANTTTFHVPLANDIVTVQLTNGAVGLNRVRFVFDLAF